MCAAMNKVVAAFPTQRSGHGVESRRGPISYVAVACLATACVAVSAHAQVQLVPNSESLPVDLLPRDRLRTRYGDFAEAINLLRRAGFLNVALVGLETSDKP